MRTNSSRFLPVSQSDITITQYKAILAKNSMVSPHSYPLSRFLKLTFHVLNRHKSNERNSCRNKMARSTPNTSSISCYIQSSLLFVLCIFFLLLLLIRTLLSLLSSLLCSTSILVASCIAPPLPPPSLRQVTPTLLL